MKVRRKPVRKKEVIKTIEKAKVKGVEMKPFDFNQGELMEVDGKLILLVDKKPILIIDREGDIVPHLLALKFVSCKTVTVDDGAVPHILRGADVMLPGIISCDELDVGSAVVVRDRLGRAIGTGTAVMASKDIEGRKSGKVIKMVHVVNDKLYEFAREL